jgi:hypothetical protein
LIVVEILSVERDHESPSSIHSDADRLGESQRCISLTRSPTALRAQ